MRPRLEQMTQSLNYGDLPKTWRVPDIERLSSGKTSYDCQTDAFGQKDALTDYHTYESGKLEIELKNLYPDLDIAKSLSNILGKQTRKRTADTVTFADGTTEKTDPATMTEPEKQHFILLIKPYLWWGE